MTAEIAILNRTAVALAADSAVTLGIRGHQKIYNSVDKLFQLSSAEPVGIMIYGNAEFMGVPFETIIKEFRTSKFSAPKEYLKEYSDSFFTFMKDEVKGSPTYSAINVKNIVIHHFENINRKAIDRLYTLSTKKVATHKKIEQYIESQILSIAKALSNNFEKLEDNKFVNTLPSDDLNVIKDSIFEVFPEDISQETIEALERVAILALKKDVFSPACTGIVFAGFGQKEMFPTLQSFTSDGMIGGDIKRLQTNFIDIDREGTNAFIAPFAQKEMIDRFLDGVDPAFEIYIYSAMRTALSELGQEIVAKYVKGTNKKKSEINFALASVASKYLEGFRKQVSDRKETNFRQKIMDMVHYMPKSDLANMAESLINLTSTKRKVSAESETVGGPVDVAVISKHEGFVWIKRKHYFSAELNPRYFVNQRLELEARGGSPK